MSRSAGKNFRGAWKALAVCAGGAFLAVSLAAPARAVTLKPLWKKHPGMVHGMAFSPDGATLALFGYWFDDEVCSLRDTQFLTPDGTRCSPYRIGLLNIRTGEPIRWLYTNDVWSFTVAFSPDGQLLIIQGTTSSSYVTRVWRVSDGTQLSFGLGGTTSRYREMLLSSDLQYAVKSVYMPKDVEDYQQIDVRRIIDGADWSARVSPASPQTPSVFLLRDPGTLGIRTSNTVQIRQFSDGAILRELTVAEWNAEKGSLLPPETPRLPRGQFLGASPEGEILASIANWPEESRTFFGALELLFWRSGQEQPLDVFKADFGCNGWPCTPPKFSPDFKYLAYSIRPTEGEGTPPSAFVLALNPYAPANRGDLDLNGTTDAVDAVESLRYVVGLDTPADDEQFRADVNANGEVTISDTVLILRRGVGLPEAAL